VKIIVGLLIAALLAIVFVAYGTGVAAFTAPAVPIEARDAEKILDRTLDVAIKPVTAEIRAWSGEVVGATFTGEIVARNRSNQTQEVIYYLESPVPLSGTVAIDYDGAGPLKPEIGYSWGQKVPIGPGAEQILYISLAPPRDALFLENTDTLRVNLKVVRWLGPRG
jgi:hypothetical protein